MLPKGSGCIRKEFRMFRELSITNTLGMRADPSLAGYPTASWSGGALFAETPNGLGLAETL